MNSSLMRAIVEVQNAAEPTFLCSCCNEEFPTEERLYVGEDEVCEGCYEEHTVVCACCNQVIWSEDSSGNDSTPLCSRCYDRYYTRCEDCGRLISQEDAYYDADEEYPYCESCYHQNNMGFHPRLQLQARSDLLRRRFSLHGSRIGNRRRRKGFF